VRDWWEREGQLSANIFNMILHKSENSLMLSIGCIDSFELEVKFPSKNVAEKNLSEKIQNSVNSAKSTREYLSAEFEAARKGN